MIKDVQVDTMDLIKWSLEKVSSETAMRCVRYALAYALSRMESVINK
jgi:hypothetical protein